LNSSYEFNNNQTQNNWSGQGIILNFKHTHQALLQVQIVEIRFISGGL